MTLEWFERVLEENVDFDESTKQSIKLPRDNPIQQIACEVYVKFVNGTSPVETNDGLLEIIKNAKLVMGAKDVKFSKSGRQWYYVEKDDMKTAPYRTTFDTTNSATHVEKVLLIHHFQADPFDRTDFSSLLPANRLSSLELFFEWGTKDDVSTNISSITDADSGVKIQIREASGTITTKDGEIDIGSANFADIREDAKDEVLKSGKTSFDSNTMKVDVTPAPATLLKNVFLQLDNDIRTNDLITDIKIQREKAGKKSLIHIDWDISWAERKTQQSLETVNTGVLALDYVDMFDGGLENLGNEGDIRYRILTATTNEAQDTLEILTRYISQSA